MVEPADPLRDALGRWPTPLLEALADAVETGTAPTTAIPADQAAAIRAIIPDLPDAHAAAWLRGAIVGYRHGLAAQQVEVVWSGPATAAVPVRTTAEALIDIVTGATRELLLTTYSARPYEPLLVALYAAHTRGVTIDIVVETLAGARSALSGNEPAAAFTDIPGVRLWHWPREQRPTESAKMHAKIAVADRHTLLVSSVNLTESGVENNIEAGIIIRGGHAPPRFAEHIDELRAGGILTALR